MRVTPQRLAVLDVVQSSTEHLCADQVYEQVRQKIPHISLATVYKALNELRDLGEVRVLPVSGKLRFDAERGNSHHHLICDRCKKVSDVLIPQGVESLEVPESARGGFEIHQMEITFRGICSDCKEQPAMSAASY